jgi:hypothetical protein
VELTLKPAPLVGDPKLSPTVPMEPSGGSYAAHKPIGWQANLKILILGNRLPGMQKRGIQRTPFICPAKRRFQLARATPSREMIRRHELRWFASGGACPADHAPPEVLLIATAW